MKILRPQDFHKWAEAHTGDTRRNNDECRYVTTVFSPEEDKWVPQYCLVGQFLVDSGVDLYDIRRNDSLNGASVNSGEFRNWLKRFHDIVLDEELVPVLNRVQRRADGGGGTPREWGEILRLELDGTLGNLGA